MTEWSPEPDAHEGPVVLAKPVRFFNVDGKGDMVLDVLTFRRLLLPPGTVVHRINFHRLSGLSLIRHDTDRGPLYARVFEDRIEVPVRVPKVFF